MISFVAPMHNHLAKSQVMLYSLLESLPDDLTYEVILVDDASTDATRAWLSNLLLPNVYVFSNDKNMGFAKNCNRGAAEAKGDFICLLNNE